LKRDYRWSNSDFAPIVIAFRAGYTIFQVVAGRLLDRMGTRRWGEELRAFRFLLGAGEAAKMAGRLVARSRRY
jgi:MFS family permease